MSAAPSPLRPKYFSAPTDALIEARNLIVDVLDERARRQPSLFEVVETPQAATPVVSTKPGSEFTQTSAVPDVLSPSAVNCFSDCEAKWFYRRALGLPEIRTAALGLGSAVHTAISENFRQKLETFEDLPYAGVRPIFLEAFANEFDSVTLEPGDDVADLVNTGESMIRVYLDRAAPKIQPKAVDLEVSGVIGGVKVGGFVDLIDVNGDIIDLKTAKKKPGAFPGAHRLQVTSYAMITPGASGRARLDTLTKTKTTDLVTHTLDVSTADRLHAEKLYSISLEQMRSGLYKPNRGSYLCSRKYCSFASQCQSDYGGSVD